MKKKRTNNLREIRESKGMTQTELGNELTDLLNSRNQKCRINQNRISDWERGIPELWRIRFGYVKGLAEILECDISDIEPQYSLETKEREMKNDL